MGHMLGSSCNSCCGATDPTDPCCTQGQLPDTVTVTFSGPQGVKSEGPPLLDLVFKACFGSGAAGVAVAPGGDPETDTGPISAATLTKAGSGYAKLGRIAPNLTITGSGEGATFTPTLESVNDDCGIPTWKIASVAVSGGGGGYANDESLTIQVADGDTVQTKALLTLATEKVEPTVEADVDGGTGAELSVTLDTSTPGEWFVDSVAVDEGGTGYTDGATVTFSAALGDVESSPASAYIVNVREEPTVGVSVSSLGESATLSVSLTQDTSGFYGNSWYVSDITIEDGGSGYSEWDEVSAFVIEGVSHPWSFFYAVVTSVDENGAILAISIFDGGAFFKDTGVIESVEVTDGGIYYREQADAVDVVNGGAYYREDSAEEPYVADVTVSIRQGWPGGGGAGAVITATVDEDTESETFGQIASLTVSNGGSGYLGWRWIYSCDCDWVYGEDPPQDHTIVAWRDRGFVSQSPLGQFGGPCVFVAPRCYGDTGRRATGPYYLVQAAVSSEFGNFSALIEGPTGKPGQDNGQILGVEWRNGDERTRFARPGRVQDAPNLIEGTDVAITATMSQQFDFTILPYWVVTGVTVPPGVDGFTNGQFVELASTTQEPLLPLEWRDEDDRSLYAVGQAVVDEDGFLTGITITNGGKFYNETSASVITATIEIVVEQYLPSQGSGAEVAATINTNLNDDDFGIATLSITNAGDGYLGGYGGDDFVVVTYPGPSSPPTVRAWRDTSPRSIFLLCETTLTAVEPIADCSDFSFEATFGEQTATVVPGGEVGEVFEGSNKCCHKCFVCCPEMPAQIVATFTRAANQGYALRVADNPKPEGTNESIQASIDNLQEQLDTVQNDNPDNYGGAEPWQAAIDRLTALIACAEADLAAEGALTGRFSFTPPLFFSGDKYYTTCAEHEVEVVWDVEELHAENACSVAPCDYLPEEVFCFAGSTVDAETEILSGGCPSPEDDVPFLSFREATTLTNAYPSGSADGLVGIGNTFLGAAVTSVFGSNYNLDPPNCPELTVTVSTAWAYHWSASSFVSVNPSVRKTKTYKKDADIACGTVPGGWDEEDQTLESNEAAGDAYLGVEDEVLQGEPEDRYVFRLLFLNPGFAGDGYSGIGRRICNNYEVSVDFQ